MVGLGGKSGTAGGGTGPAPNGDPNPYGRGDYDPVHEISEWYEAPQGTAGSQGHTLTQIWARHRDLIEQDFHTLYRLDVDLASPAQCPVLTSKDWRWFLVRFRGLLNTPTTRLWVALQPEPRRTA